MSNTTLAVPLTPAAGDVVPLVNYVEAKDALKVQAAISRLLLELSGTGSGTASGIDGIYKPPFSNTYGPKDAWDLPAWHGDEEAAAAWILGVIGPNQRRVLVRLIAGGPDGVWTGELRRMSGYDESTSMSGVFKALGGRFRSTGLRPVWNGGEKDSQKGQRLRVLDDKARALFADVIKHRYSELAEEFGLTGVPGDPCVPGVTS